MVDKVTSNRYIDLNKLPMVQAPQLLPTRCLKVPSPSKIELPPLHRVPSSHRQLNDTGKKSKSFTNLTANVVNLQFPLQITSHASSEIGK